ncbi:MAG: four helix bundle protein [Luteibaculaceae bacterium]
MGNFKNLEVWKNSRALVKEIYLVTKEFPDAEKFGLTNQLRRAAISISANIAEGSGRNTDKDFRHFLTMSLGSTHEVECLLILSNDLNFLNAEDFENLEGKTIQIQKQLNSFIKKLS